MIKDLWYKNAIIYCLSVGTYMDANGDGIGDFQGLMRRLDYLHGLGVTAIWLMPFQNSPGRDDGYDISDYRRAMANRFCRLGGAYFFRQGPPMPRRVAAASLLPPMFSEPARKLFLATLV
jgi:maltose alpha-D-glucosyltransferase/alpha-amylase